MLRRICDCCENDITADPHRLAPHVNWSVDSKARNGFRLTVTATGDADVCPECAFKALEAFAAEIGLRCLASTDKLGRSSPAFRELAQAIGVNVDDTRPFETVLADARARMTSTAADPRWIQALAMSASKAPRAAGAALELLDEVGVCVSHGVVDWSKVPG